MNQLKKIEIKVGIVTLAALALFIIGFTWGKGFKSSYSRQTIHIRFANSSGIQISAPLVVNGVTRGSVLSIRNDNGGVLIEADIDSTSDFRKDVSARIMILEITGGKKIEIAPGIADEKFYIKSEIPGKTSADLSELIAMAGDVANHGRIMFRRVDTILAAISSIVGKPEFTNRINGSIDNLYNVSNTLDRSLNDENGSLYITIKNLRILSSDLREAYQGYNPKINALLDKLDRITDDASQLITNAKSTLRRSDTLLSNFNEISDSIKNGSGLVPRLINDQALAARLDSALAELSLLASQLRQYGINTNVRLGSRP
ncbi:MAG: phospholipid/cholesterol/gamma-HCH transport system substrate-binding protein [Bacteroidota bacterium]|nr:phospholipid/cholesterol/gamma-HCH transport system substrate-binding protein [Bacteroidota bacterium]